eukprot:11161068-Lingulodinium_polyedra.AAC.1
MLAAAVGHPWPEERRTRPIVLLSLFDGTGTARLALDDFLRTMRRPGAMVGSFFAEVDAKLAAAVQN